MSGAFFLPCVVNFFYYAPFFPSTISSRWLLQCQRNVVAFTVAAVNAAAAAAAMTLQLVTWRAARSSTGLLRPSHNPAN